MKSFDPRHARGRGGRAQRRPRLGRRLASERGAMSLLEMLVTAPMMLMIVAAIYFLYNQSVPAQGRTDARVRSLSQVQVGLQRIERDLRQATRLDPVSSQVVDMDTYVAPSGTGSAVPRHVQYDCGGGACKRYEDVVGSTTFASGPITIVANVENTDVFSMEPDFINPNFAAIKLEVTPAATNTQTASPGGTAFRNPITITGGVGLKSQASARDN